jgi:hypothetical protein
MRQEIRASGASDYAKSDNRRALLVRSRNSGGDDGHQRSVCLERRPNLHRQRIGPARKDAPISATKLILIGEPGRARRKRSIMTVKSPGKPRFGKLAAVSIFALLGSTAAFSQQPPPGVQVGMLSCNLAPSVGLIVVESQRMSCRFVPNGPHPPQTYSGVMNTVGLELGVTAAGVMA